MKTVSETTTWEPDIRIIEIGPYSFAGINGILNEQAQQLANRTAYLKGIADRALPDLSALINDKTLSYAGVSAVAEGDIASALGERCTYKVAASSATDHDLTTAGGVKLYAQPMQSGPVSAIALGCDVQSTMNDAKTAADATAKIQTVLDRGYDVLVPGWVHLGGKLRTNGRRILGTGRSLSGFWASASESGIQMFGNVSKLQDFHIESDYTAMTLVEVGNGPDAGSFDMDLTGIKAQGARSRSLLVRENANWKADRCEFKNAGADGDSVIGCAAEIRSVGSMTDCIVANATGWAMLITRYDGDDPEDPFGWEETRFEFKGGRIHKGKRGHLKVVNYTDKPEVCWFDGVLWENPGIQGDGDAAIVAQGPSAILRITNSRKAQIRTVSEFCSARDGGVILDADIGALLATDLGQTPGAALCDVHAAPSTTYTTGLNITEPGQLVNNGGTIYAPKPDRIPFTTGSFDADQWEDVTQYQGPGRVRLREIPNFQTSAENDFSLFTHIIRTPHWKAADAPPFDMPAMRKIATLIDGTADPSILPGWSLGPAGSTIALTTTAGEYLTKGGAVTFTSSATATPFVIAFDLDITEELAGQYLAVSCAVAYTQIGATFGSGGDVGFLLSVEGAAADVFPADTSAGWTSTLSIDEAPGDGNMTGWYKGLAVFRTLQPGTLKVKIRFDGQGGVSRTVKAHLDRVELFGLPSIRRGAVL